MKTIILIYKTDCNHSYASRDIIGIVENESLILPIIEQQAEKEGQQIDLEQEFNIINIKQTQGYIGEGEFQAEPVQINVLL